jgi:beta-mannanase
VGRSVHRHIDIVNFYVGWAFPGFDTGDLNSIRARGAVPEITWEPWDYRDGLNQPRFSLSRIINGKLDWYIKSFAAAAAAWRHPLMLRFAQEANGNWYPWSTGLNGNTPGQYAAAYRHIHNLFVAAGATNVIWIWSPNAIYRGATSLRSIYPGRKYVDWIGVDGYNAGAHVPGRGGWRTPTKVFAPTFKALAQLAPHKPIMIAETGSAEAGGSKATWIRRLFKLLKTRPQVRALCWFNYHKAADWMINSSAASQRSMTLNLARYWRRS